MDNEIQAQDLIAALKEQRNVALDQAAIQASLTAKLLKDIQALRAELAKLKPEGGEDAA